MRCQQLHMDREKKRRGGAKMDQRLINAKELEDFFLYGINDMSVLGDQELDERVIEIIRQQHVVKAVPYYEIARAILKIRSINSNFEYIRRQDVIDVLWRLIDVKTEMQEAEEAVNVI